MCVSNFIPLPMVGIWVVIQISCGKDDEEDMIQ